jgi:hypothetical protein
MSQDTTNLITVFSTQKEAVLIVAKSILDDARIKYLTSNEFLHHLAYGSAEGMVIKVPLEKAEEARKLLENLDSDITEETVPPYTLDPKHNITPQKIQEFNTFVAIVAVIAFIAVILVVVTLIRC